MGYLGSLRYQVHKKTANTTTVTFETEPVRKGEIVKVTAAYVADFTSTNTKLILGTRNQAGTDHYVHVVQEGHTFSAHLDGQIQLIEGERMIGIVTDPGSGDELYFTVHGDRFEIPEV